MTKKKKLVGTEDLKPLPITKAMRDNITHLDDLKPHFNGLAMCVACKKRWIATVVKDTSLFKLECPECGDQDSFFSFLPDEYLEEFGR